MEKYLRGSLVTQLNVADDFYEAYIRCFSSDKNNHIVSIPAFVNGFFACELYLKSLLKKENKIHNLKNLYDLLDENIKKEIQSVKLDENIKKEIKSIKLDEKYCFEKLLEIVGDGFAKWRYFFEDDNDFGNESPFYLSENFLNIYLKVFREIAHKNNDSTKK